MKILRIVLLSMGLLLLSIVTAGYIALYVLPTGPEPTTPRPISIGKDSFVMQAWRHSDRKRIKVWTYRPENWGAGDRMLFVMHGMGRNGEDYRDAWVELAERKRLLVVAPEFDSRFRNIATNDYQEGNLHNYFGRKLPEDEWAFTVIENVFDYIKASNGFVHEDYDLFGHSAGGQFVHRMLLLKPDARIGTAIAANAGAYTFPDASMTYPYGMDGMDSDLDAALGKRLVVLLGERDTQASQGRLDQSAPAMAQGTHRLARGRRFFEVALQQAATRGVVPAWELHVVPGAGHEYRKMSEAAADLL